MQYRITIHYDFTRSDGEVERRTYVTKDREDYLRCLDIFRQQPDKYKFASENLETA